MPATKKPFHEGLKLPARFKAEEHSARKDYHPDRIALVQAGERRVVVRKNPLDVKEIRKLVAFDSGGCTYHKIWFKDSKGQPFERSCVLNIEGKWHYVDYKYLRVAGIEKEAENRRVLIDNFPKRRH